MSLLHIIIPKTPNLHTTYPTRHPITSHTLDASPTHHHQSSPRCQPYTSLPLNTPAPTHHIPAQQPYTSAPPTCHLYTSSPSTRHTYTPSYFTSHPEYNAIPYKWSLPFTSSTNLQKLNQIQHISKSTAVWLDLIVKPDARGRFYL